MTPPEFIYLQDAPTTCPINDDDPKYKLVQPCKWSRNAEIETPTEPDYNIAHTAETK